MTVEVGIDSVVQRGADIHFNNGDLELAIVTYRKLLSSKRPSVVERAARFILKHETTLKKVETPQETNNNHNVNITIRRIDAEENHDSND